METSLSYEQADQKHFSTTLTLAHTAKLNGLSVAQQSYDLCSRLLKVCRNGINRLDDIPGAFLLGKRFIFKPQLVALSEGEIASSTNSTASNNNSGTIRSPWLSANLKIFGKVQEITDQPDTKIMAEGRTISERLAEEAPSLPAIPETIIYDSSLLLKAEDRLPNESEKKTAPTSLLSGPPLSLSEYPFKGLPVGEKQLIYYAQKALNSGEKMVMWSTLVRDYVAYQDQGEQQSNGRIGLAVSSNTRGWFSRNEQDDPKLACEWQLRAPIVILDQQMKDALKGATLTNPKTGQRMPLVPPIGPNLM